MILKLLVVYEIFRPDSASLTLIFACIEEEILSIFQTTEPEAAETPNANGVHVIPSRVYSKFTVLILPEAVKFIVLEEFVCQFSPPKTLVILTFPILNTASLESFITVFNKSVTFTNACEEDRFAGIVQV